VGNCSFDVRHIFNSSLVAMSPHFDSGLAKTILGNCSFHHRELPLRQPLFGAGRDRSSLTGIKQDRADLIADPKFGSCPGGQVGSSTAFSTPAQFTNAAAGSFGNSGRNMLVGPGNLNFNTGVSRQFKIREGQSLMLRGEVFNVFNHPNFANPVSTNAGVLASAGPPPITPLLPPLRSAGYHHSGTPRVFQLRRSMFSELRSSLVR